VFQALINAFRAPDIRRRILFVLGMLVVYRFLAVVPVPRVNHAPWPTSSTARPSCS
jgi:preprotein translocase subunit SecY